MFWKVSGFSQPSSIEKLLDKDEFTLAELLDEEDIIQECKSLNGRLVAFLRERSTVDQLVRYLVEPADDSDDPKRTYKYPFTACEVLCCEVEAVFSTLVEDAELRVLFFSLLDAPPPLSSKTAGYFGRVLSLLLIRKAPEIMSHLQDQPRLLERLILHVDTASIADIVKRIVGADGDAIGGGPGGGGGALSEAAAHAKWLADTPLLDLLLARLSAGHSADVQANAADILSAIAHTQPSPLASRLTHDGCITALFQHAMRPDHLVLVPCLDVCVALIEPKRSLGDPGGGGGPTSGSAGGAAGSMDGGAGKFGGASGGSSGGWGGPDFSTKAKAEAVRFMLQYVPQLVEFLRAETTDTGAGGAGGEAPAPAPAAAATPATAAAMPVPYGVLRPPLGRARLKVVELLAVLLRSGDASAERAMVESGGLAVCLHLFARYPFNNLLHHQVTSMLVAALVRSSTALLQHLFAAGSSVLDWLVALPSEVRPEPRPGQEALAASKPPLRAGYLGHVTQLGAVLDMVAQSTGILPPLPPPVPIGGTPAGRSAGGSATSQGGAAGGGGAAEGGVVPAARAAMVAGFLEAHGGWQAWRSDVLRPRQEVENTSRWACGRPAIAEMAGLESDGDEFQTDMDLEQISGMQPALYHRYHSADEADDEEDGGAAGGGAGGGGQDAGGNSYGDRDADAFSIERDLDAFGPDLDGEPFGTQAMVDAISGMDLNDRGSHDIQDSMAKFREARARLLAYEPTHSGADNDAGTGEVGMEDDDVLLATSDDDDDELLAEEGQDQGAAAMASDSPDSAAAAQNHSAGGGSSGGGGPPDDVFGGGADDAFGSGADDMVIVDDASVVSPHREPQPWEAAGDSSADATAGAQPHASQQTDGGGGSGGSGGGGNEVVSAAEEAVKAAAEEAALAAQQPAGTAAGGQAGGEAPGAGSVWGSPAS